MSFSELELFFYFFSIVAFWFFLYTKQAVCFDIFSKIRTISCIHHSKNYLPELLEDSFLTTAPAFPLGLEKVIIL